MTILYWGRVTSSSDTLSGCADHSDIGLLGAYFSIDKMRLLLLSVLVAVAIVGASGLFIAQYGVDVWETTVTRAKSLMVINFDTPIPVNTAPMGSHLGTAQQQRQIIDPPTTLYICPTCGIVGYPRFPSPSIPICPNCGIALNKLIQPK